MLPRPSAETLEVVHSPTAELGLSPVAYVAEPLADAMLLPGHEALYLNVQPRRAGASRQAVFRAEAHVLVAPGAFAINGLHRTFMGVSPKDTLAVRVVPPPPIADQLTLSAKIFLKGNVGPYQLDLQSLSQDAAARFQGNPLRPRQELIFDTQGVRLLLSCQSFDLAEAVEERVGSVEHGHSALIGPATRLRIGSSDPRLRLEGGDGATLSLADLRFASLGIGGLEAECEELMRRAFHSRTLPAALLRQLGVAHVRGILLHGPPGTGKTLIARQIASTLSAAKVRVVNGPEILSSYVGASEKNMRELFAEAEQDADKSRLHVIIFDEIESLCRRRGASASDTGVGDRMVNQLLTKIDGVEALENILVIGMTNRRDLLDDALLRPGRMEVQIQIGLPDRHGRGQILKIHTQKMREAGCLGADVDLDRLADETENYSGAELAGLVRSATSFALRREPVGAEGQAVEGALSPARTVVVGRDDLRLARQEVQPALGVKKGALEDHLRGPKRDLGPRFHAIERRLAQFVAQVGVPGAETSLVSLLIHGPAGSGKSALAARTALDSHFPLVHHLSVVDFEGLGEHERCKKVAEVFENAYRSRLSLVVLDDIEELIGYTPLGLRFSSSILQTLRSRMRQNPPDGRRLCVLATSSLDAEMRAGLQMQRACTAAFELPPLNEDEVACVLGQELGDASSDWLRTAAELACAAGRPLGIKRLLVATEALKMSGCGSTLEAWRELIELPA